MRAEKGQKHTCRQREGHTQWSLSMTAPGHTTTEGDQGRHRTAGTRASGEMDQATAQEEQTLKRRQGPKPQGVQAKERLEGKSLDGFKPMVVY